MNIQEPSEDVPRRSNRARIPNNALQAGILAYLKSLSYGPVDTKLLPKKYTLYPPLLILPVNFASASEEWQVKYENLSGDEKLDLFSHITAAFKPQIITHIAINAAISPETVNNGTENVMRSPSNITPVYGDFGPDALLDPNNTRPTQADFDAAFWISPTQNGGIVQTWAPRWTMFSRGNITEKARILDEGNSMKGLSNRQLGEDFSCVDVADFYVGIGYFAFSYLKRGARTVFGWDINAWSIEGMRRGCVSNGWDCFVATLDENGSVELTQLDHIVHFLSSNRNKGKCVAFLGDNKFAPLLLAEINRLRCEGSPSDGQNVSGVNTRHVNLGLLPTARASWQDAIRVMNHKKGGWLHVHENVDIKDIDSKRAEMINSFERIVHDMFEGSWHVSCCHVEQVKTYAPGVMHCVFDIVVGPMDPT
jgi:tRNA wybutosine-synthesizing protein 2